MDLRRYRAGKEAEGSEPLRRRPQERLRNIGPLGADRGGEYSGVRLSRLNSQFSDARSNSLFAQLECTPKMRHKNKDNSV